MGKKKAKSVKKPNGRSAQQQQLNSSNSSKSGTSGTKKKNHKTNKKERNENHIVSQNSSNYNDDGFRKILQAEGSKIIKDMESDGNCLFRSLSDQLFNDYGSKHVDVRNEICDFLEKNEKKFASFLLLDEDQEDVCCFNEYVSRMRNDGEWGGDVEIVCATRLYKRNIRIFSSQGEYKIEYDEEDISGHDLLLSYHENSHYNSVIDENLKKQWKSQPKKRNKDEESSINNNNNNNDNKNNNDNNKNGKKQISDDSNKKDDRPLQRNAICPCGSKLKYKKCCQPKDKLKKRQEKIRARFGLNDEDEENEKDAKETCLSDNTDSSFRLMTI